MHLHHNVTVHLSAPKTKYAYDLQLPLRKMVDCRTRDLHQSLLVKLNRALVRQGKTGGPILEGTKSARPFPHHSLLEGTGQLFNLCAAYCDNTVLKVDAALHRCSPAILISSENLTVVSVSACCASGQVVLAAVL